MISNQLSTAPAPAGHDRFGLGHDRHQCDCEACRIFRRAAGIDPPAKREQERDSVSLGTYLADRLRREQQPPREPTFVQRYVARLKQAAFLDTLEAIGAAVERRAS